jgi:hypothetical protein
VGPLGEFHRALAPENVRVERAGHHVQHRVILGQHVHAAARLRHPHELREHAIHVRHGLDHVAVRDQVEAVVGLREPERVAGLELQPRRERGVSGARVFHRRGEQLDAKHGRVRMCLCNPRAELSGARADVQHPRTARQPVEVDQPLFLRPDGFDLRGEIADHGFVRHLRALGIECGAGHACGFIHGASLEYNPIKLK